ncbi:hypothetical protein CDO30_29315 (plasmid) [Sinorhizobium meliloti]|nr:hypothetical protein CDO30_29315 [Sinorhizobium meliloti]
MPPRIAVSKTGRVRTGRAHRPALRPALGRCGAFPPSFLCLSQGSSSAASAARKGASSPRTWAGWFPVTGTGMRILE